MPSRVEVVAAEPAVVEEGVAEDVVVEVATRRGTRCGRVRRR
jgi:hypothetical protein